MPAVCIPTIQAAATAGILESTRRGGGDVGWIIGQANLTLAELSLPENRLPLRKFVTLIEAASHSTQDDCFGAHLGEHCALSELGLPGYLAHFAPTVERALSSFARYYALLGDATDVRFEARHGRAAFTYRVLDRASWPRRQDAEQLLTMIVTLLRGWIGSHFRPDVVWFEHRKPRDAHELERIFGCEVRFGCETNTVWFAEASAGHENPNADQKLFHLLSWFAEKAVDRAEVSSARTFLAQVLDSVDSCANLGNAGIHSVARALGLEARTLQRRLRLERTSFRELHDEVMQRQSVKLLTQSDMSEKEISARLGYSAVNSFIRAFRRWHQVTPGQFREREAGVACVAGVAEGGRASRVAAGARSGSDLVAPGASIVVS